MSIARPHHRFSLADYEQMIDLGILTENDRVELIRGEIIEKMSIGEFHAACVRILTRRFGHVVGEQATVSPQSPIKLAESVPEPDVALLVPRPDDYAASHPEPDDIYLLVEVADASLDFDRQVKGPLYAENGVAEYWILNLPDRTLEVHRQPLATGQYAEVRVLQAGDSTDLVKLPGVTLAVAELFPPAAER
jgi:Uma2 family endonuclease